MKTSSHLITISIILLSSCDKQIVEPDLPGMLEQTGILGTWEIHSYEINGITDLSVNCCEFTEFKEDSRPDDYNGTYRTYGPGYESTGIFTINPTNSTLSFGDSSSQTVYEYDIQDEYLTFIYSENEDEIVLTYINRD